MLVGDTNYFLNWSLILTLSREILVLNCRESFIQLVAFKLQFEGASLNKQTATLKHFPHIFLTLFLLL